MFRAFSFAAVLAAFALAVLGSWVRINGAGMTCPDWPLCNGHLIPTFEGGVILEWSHRLVAFIEGFLVIGAIVTGWQARKRIAYIRPALAFIGVVFALQVFLGAATVALSNNPPSVAWHWAIAMLFLGALTTLAILAIAQPPVTTARKPQSGLYGVLAGTVVAAFIATCAGAFVSASGAGLACPSFPACGDSVAGFSSAQAAQMFHRLVALVFFGFATIAAYWAALATTDRVRIATLIGYALVVLQILLGIANIAWALPVSLREAHAANAGAAFLAFVAACVFATLDGTVRESVATRHSVVTQTSSS